MRFTKSLTELVVLTYLASFVSFVTVAGFDYLDIASWKAAALSAVPAALVALYGALAKQVGDKSSPLATARQANAEAVER